MADLVDVEGPVEITIPKAGLDDAVRQKLI